MSEADPPNPHSVRESARLPSINVTREVNDIARIQEPPGIEGEVSSSNNLADQKRPSILRDRAPKLAPIQNNNNMLLAPQR